MSQILDGIIEYSSTTKNANGGTELMMRQMVDNLDNNLLSKFQIIHSRLNDHEVLKDRKTILVCHDLPHDKMYEKLKKIDHGIDLFVFVSYWQQQYFQFVWGLSSENCVVIPNGILPFDIRQTEKKNIIKLIYHTTPHRGLEILIPVFEQLCEKYDNLYLDIFSSFEAYGWGEKDRPYKHLMKNTDKISYHGFKPNEVIREYLMKSDIFAYPSIYPETSCIAAIEALCAGNKVVCSSLAALPETCCNFADLYSYNPDKEKHAKVFYRTLDQAIKNMDNFNPHFQQAYMNNVYGYDRVKSMWESILKSL